MTLNIAGKDAVLSVTTGTGSQVSSGTERQVAYGYDAFIIPSFVSVSPITEADAAFDPATDLITSTAHGIYTGMVFRLTTTGSLPTGLSTGTDYWAIRESANTIKLASSLANAEAGTGIDITGAGSGNHTLTQQTDVATYTIQVSPDNSNWAAIDTMSAVSIVGVTMIHKHVETAARYIRLQVSISKGAATLTGYLQSKG